MGYVVATVLANDADVGSNGQVAYYGSPQQLVEINNMTGEIILLISPDFETLSTQSLQVNITFRLFSWAQIYNYCDYDNYR